MDRVAPQHRMQEAEELAQRVEENIAIQRRMIAKVTCLTWTEDLRQVSYRGQRDDKPATQVVRPVPHPPAR